MVIVDILNISSSFLYSNFDIFHLPRDYKNTSFKAENVVNIYVKLYNSVVCILFTVRTFPRFYKLIEGLNIW